MIFWEHIKGLNINNGTKAWTYINFINSLTNDLTITNNPSIGFGDSGYNENDNYILTTDMLGGYINNSFTFYNNVDFKINSSDEQPLTIQYNSTYGYWNINNSNKTIYISGYGAGAQSAATLNLGNRASISLKESTIAIAMDGEVQLKPTTDKNVKVDHILYFDQLMAREASDRTSGYDGSCTATYFNATSDYRAKKDFKELNIDALELINKVRLYSFKYKDSNQPSIGIIAQDVQDVNIEGFDLVDNKTATGDNFDYMTIHESKLIYILWKAIQEQQKEIETLKQQLNK